MREESKDYLTAFVIGAMVGVGTALILAPEKEKKHRRYRIRPRRRLRRKRSLRRVLRERF